MRGSESRRCSSINRPARHMMPATPPNDDGGQLLGRMRNAQRLKHDDRGQKPAGVPHENDQIFRHGTDCCPTSVGGGATTGWTGCARCIAPGQSGSGCRSENTDRQI